MNTKKSTVGRKKVDPKEKISGFTVYCKAKNVEKAKGLIAKLIKKEGL